MQFSLFDLVLLVGIIQGFILSVLLLKSKKNPASNKFLALGLLAFSFLSTKPLLHTLSLWDTPVFRFFPNGMEVVVAPLFFFYLKSLLTSNFRFKRKYWLHFLPFFITQIYAFIVYFAALSTNDFDEKDAIARGLGFDTVKQLDEYFLLGAVIIYIFNGYKMLKNYKHWLDNTTSDSAFPDFKWLTDIFKLFIITGIFLLVNHLLNIADIGDYHWRALNLFVAFLIYYLGLRGYLQPHYSLPEEEKSLEVIPPSEIPAINIKSREVAVKIEKAMVEDKLFLDPKLSVHELAKQVQSPPREVSQNIKQHFNMSFRDFINYYRVEEVKTRLNSSGYEHLTILGIALECGFNSEASFYRIFKKHIGMSPKEYMQQQKS